MDDALFARLLGFGLEIACNAGKAKWTLSASHTITIIN